MAALSATDRSAQSASAGGIWDNVLSADQLEFNLEPGSSLFCEGDDADCVYEVLKGVVCSYSLLSDGRRQVVGFAYPGDLVGLCHQPIHQASCDSVSTARVRSIARSRLFDIINEQPELGSRLLECVTGQLAGMQRHFVLLGRKCAQEKLATFLLALAQRYGSEDNGTVTLILPMTRSDIADYLGLTVETVSRSFTKLRAAGIVVLPQSTTVHICNMLKLKNVAEITDGRF